MEKSLDILTDSIPEGNLQLNQFGKLTHAALVTGSSQAICLSIFKMSWAPEVLGDWLKDIGLYLRKKKRRKKKGKTVFWDLDVHLRPVFKVFPAISLI